jgi:predicted RecB family nuclease
MKDIETIRDDLANAARREPEHVQPFIAQIDRQLRNYARSNAEDRIALRPQIDGSIKRLEASRAGR